MAFEYRIFKSVNGMVGSGTGPVPLLTVLNVFGQHGGELVSVVSDGPGTLIVFSEYSLPGRDPGPCLLNRRLGDKGTAYLLL
jgi:hypothetical protein